MEGTKKPEHTATTGDEMIGQLYCEDEVEYTTEWNLSTYFLLGFTKGRLLYERL